MLTEIHGARAKVQKTLKWMLAELTANRLEVCKIPSRIQGYRRIVIACNCEWYQELCRRYEYPRKRYPKFRTMIRRCATIRALTRMIAGDYRGVYAERILSVMETMECGLE